jgi:hypothetical protein
LNPLFDEIENLKSEILTNKILYEKELNELFIDFKK